MIKSSTLPLFLLAGGLLVGACGGNDPATVDAEVGDAIDAAEAQAGQVMKSVTYDVVPGQSKVMWTGSKFTGDSHTGTLDVRDGRIAVANGKLVGGEFTIDMNSLADTDLEGEGKAKLEGHLKSADFFDTEKYPEATFTLVQVQPVTGQDGVTHTLTGNLKMLDATKSITIPANVVVTDESITAVTPAFEINRTDWGVKYGSGLLGVAQDKAISDEVKLVIDLKASRA